MKILILIFLYASLSFSGEGLGTIGKVPTDPLDPDSSFFDEDGEGTGTIGKVPTDPIDLGTIKQPLKSSDKESGGGGTVVQPSVACNDLKLLTLISSETLKQKYNIKKLSPSIFESELKEFLILLGDKDFDVNKHCRDNKKDTGKFMELQKFVNILKKIDDLNPKSFCTDFKNSDIEDFFNYVRKK